MTKTIRRQYEGSFKLKVVLETYRNEKTLAQIASEYQVHATQIHIWRNQLKQEGPAIFQKTKDGDKADIAGLNGFES